MLHSGLAWWGQGGPTVPSCQLSQCCPLPLQQARPTPHSPHSPSPWPLASKSINSPNSLSEEEALRMCGQQSPNHLPRLALEPLWSSPITLRCQTHLFCEHKKPGRLWQWNMAAGGSASKKTIQQTSDLCLCLSSVQGTLGPQPCCLQSAFVRVLQRNTTNWVCTSM